MEIDAPAKINLSLRVLGKRVDGFHELRSLMLPLALADTIRIHAVAGQGLAFTCTDPSLPTDGDNLVVRAARLFLERTGVTQGLEIELVKRVPHGAGLGGGSSDAASTLLTLDRMFATGVDTATLASWSAELGSDIPFFVYGSAAWIRGRGEIVEPVAFPHEIPILLIKPPFGVPTPWAYKNFATSEEIPGVDYAPQATPWGEMVNDLERPVFEKYIVLAELKRALRQQAGALGALLSGSGSTVFAVLEPGDAEAIAERVQVITERVEVEFGNTFQVIPTRTRTC